MACAAAISVLEIIEEENLLEKGISLGNLIDNLFSDMVDRNTWNCVGDIRSLGCMNAIELVTDLDSHEPAGALTAEIVKTALAKGLILVTAGPARNVIRILVPLSATNEIIEEGMKILENSITETLCHFT